MKPILLWLVFNLQNNKFKNYNKKTAYKSKIWPVEIVAGSYL